MCFKSKKLATSISKRGIGIFTVYFSVICLVLLFSVGCPTDGDGGGPEYTPTEQEEQIVGAANEAVFTAVNEATEQAMGEVFGEGEELSNFKKINPSFASGSNAFNMTINGAVGGTCTVTGDINWNLNEDTMVLTFDMSLDFDFNEYSNQAGNVIDGSVTMSSTGTINGETFEMSYSMTGSGEVDVLYEGNPHDYSFSYTIEGNEESITTTITQTLDGNTWTITETYET